MGAGGKGPAPFWSFPRMGRRADNPATGDTDWFAAVASKHEPSPAGFAHEAKPKAER